MKRLFFLFLTAIFALTQVSAYDFFSDNDDGVRIYYTTKSDKEAEVVMKPNQGKYVGNINIPEEVEAPNGINYTVTSIGEKAFMNCTELDSVSIPNTVITIKHFAFSSSSLASVYIGNSVKNVLAYAFSECSKLKSVTIPNSVISIGAFAFYECSGMESATLSDAITIIDQCTFSGCSRLQSIIIPNSVTRLEQKAFYKCTALKSVSMPSTVTYIGSYAFYCSGLKFANIPQSVTLIKEGTFLGCSRLESVCIPNSITSIDEEAFENCVMLKSLSIPSSVTSIGSNAFRNCRGLKSLHIEDGDSELKIAENTYDYVGVYIKRSFYGCKFEDLYVGRNLSSWQALCCSSALKCLAIGNTVSAIGDYAFMECAELESVTIPNSVTEIGMQAFQNTGIKSLTIPNSVIYIGYGAFQSCKSLSSVCIDEGGEALSLGGNVFRESTINDLIVGRNLDSGPYYAPESPFVGLNTLKRVWVPDGVTTFPAYMFSQCRSLTHAYVGNGMTKIDNEAFSGCANLKMLKIGRSVVEIEDNALTGCVSITDIYAEPMIAPSLSNETLASIDKSECSLHYHPGASYDADPLWKDFIHTDHNFEITLDREVVTAKKGAVFQLTPVESKETDVEWLSSNSSIATVSATGLVSIHKTQPVTIAAILPTGHIASCVINGREGGEEVGGIMGVDYRKEVNSYADIASDEWISIYTLSGKLIYRGLKINVPALSSGFYIIKCIDSVFKQHF